MAAGDTSSEEYNLEDEEEDLMEDDDIELEDDDILKAPSTRDKKKKKRTSFIVESDESDHSDEEELKMNGYPLEDPEEPQVEIVEGDFVWNKVVNPMTKFPWVKEIDEINQAGLKRIKKTDFLRKNPFQILQSFIPLKWFEKITEETNK